MGDVVSIKEFKGRRALGAARMSNIERMASCKACGSRTFKIYYDERSEYPFLRCSGCETTIGGDGDNWRIQWFKYDT